MNKKYLIIGLIAFFSISILTIVFFIPALRVPKSERHVYLKHFGNKDSNIFIDCNKDADCKLISRKDHCGGFVSVNENNNKIEIKKYHEKENELLEGVEFDCGIPPAIEDYQPICINNICASEKK